MPQQYPTSVTNFCLNHWSIAVKRHHHQSNSSKRKHLRGGLFTVLETGGIQAGSGTVADSYLLICRQTIQRYRNVGKQISTHM